MKFLHKYDIECKYIRDPIYGFIELPKNFLPILDNHLFQRLRWISQLPLQQLSYPSAMHSRFEHSIGTMYLAMKAADSIILNSHEFLEQYVPGFDEKEFIELAGLAGLLHDVGHAPFSHTLENACKYLSNISYDHEVISYQISKKILEDTHLDSKYDHMLKILNKKLSLEKEEIEPIDYFIRSIIDGPFDIDKGDYLLRDSYHCGVIYGLYDISNLWDNILLTKSMGLGILEKGAIECWTLRFARYKMFQNVYNHHVRDITDALLQEIIYYTFNEVDNIECSPLLPTKNGKLETRESFDLFYYWTDDHFIYELFNKKNEKALSKIERFRERKLYKRFFDLNLEDFEYFESSKNKILDDLMILKNEYENKNINFNFIIYDQKLFPHLEAEVQEKILVYKDRKDINPVTLAHFLEIETDKRDINYREKPKILRFFADKNDLCYKDKIKKEVEEILNVKT